MSIYTALVKVRSIQLTLKKVAVTTGSKSKFPTPHTVHVAPHYSRSFDIYTYT